MSDLKDYMRQRIEADIRRGRVAHEVIKQLAGSDEVISQPAIDMIAEMARRGAAELAPFSNWPDGPEMRQATPRERTILARHWREITS